MPRPHARVIWPTWWWRSSRNRSRTFEMPPCALLLACVRVPIDARQLAWRTADPLRRNTCWNRYDGVRRTLETRLDADLPRFTVVVRMHNEPTGQIAAGLSGTWMRRFLLRA